MFLENQNSRHKERIFLSTGKNRGKRLEIARRSPLINQTHRAERILPISENSRHPFKSGARSRFHRPRGDKDRETRGMREGIGRKSPREERERRQKVGGIGNQAAGFKDGQKKGGEGGQQPRWRVRKIRGSGVEPWGGTVPWGINTAPTERNTNSNYEYLGSGSKRHRKSLTGFRHPASFASTATRGWSSALFRRFQPLPPVPPLIAPTGPPSAEYQRSYRDPFCSYFRINPLPFPHLVSCRKLISNYGAGDICCWIEERGRTRPPFDHLLPALPTTIAKRQPAFRPRPFSLLVPQPGFFNFPARFDLW